MTYGELAFALVLVVSFSKMTAFQAVWVFCFASCLGAAP